ncbi:MAG TPA: hypothetical protein VEU78_07465 [Steroidobacteraceae bacterium]|nr:hypothetical protein [Steroidobacteraceae bacterium]
MAAPRSTRAEIIVGDGFRRHTLAAWRPAIIPLMRAQMFLLRDNWLLEFEGTREQLVAAGLAEDAWFVLEKSSKRSGFDEFGNKFHLEATEQGRFRLSRRTGAGDYLGDIPARFKSWRTHRAALRADVLDTLERIRRGNRPK